MSGLLRSELLKQRTTRTSLWLPAWMAGLILLVVLLHVFSLPRPLPRRTPLLPHRPYPFRRLRGTGNGMTRVRLLALLVAVAVLAVSAAGCGGTASDTRSTTATVAGASPPPKLSKQQQARKRGLTKLARCMRAHGASFPDPTPDGRISGGMATVSAAINGPNGQQALSACWSYVLAVRKTLGGAYGP